MIWDATTAAASVEAGAIISVSSPHRVVRILTADQVCIEASDGLRRTALVLDRSDNEITLIFSDESAQHLTLAIDDSVHKFTPDKAFSSQSWMVKAHDA